MATVTVFHEANSEDATEALRNGLKLTSVGDKTDKLIRQTDEYLDLHRPADILDAEIGRCGSNYAYLVENGYVIDIVDGKKVPIPAFIEQSDNRVLALSVDDAKCYVSDLESYDEVKRAIDAGHKPVSLAAAYWNRVVPLPAYKRGLYTRPEVMILSDIDAAGITEVTGQ